MFHVGLQVASQIPLVSTSLQSLCLLTNSWVMPANLLMSFLPAHNTFDLEDKSSVREPANTLLGGKELLPLAF
jgi:hypothetical protein